MVGGLIALMMNRRKNVDEKTKELQNNDGTLYCAGMIAGEGLIGIFLAILAVFEINLSKLPIISEVNFGIWGSIVVLAAIILLLLKSSLWGKHKASK
jgi:hypothetical protein